MNLISPDALAIITIWQEARGEPLDGKIAVGEVICNRMLKKYSSDGTVAGTVCRAFQFSGWLPRDPNLIPSLKLDTDDPIVDDCVRAWREASTGGTEFAKGAVLYCNLAVVRPTWIINCTLTAKVGAHSFFTPSIRV